MQTINDYEVTFNEEKPIEYELKKIGGIAVYDFNKSDYQLVRKYDLPLKEVRLARLEYELWKWDIF